MEKASFFKKYPLDKGKKGAYNIVMDKNTWIVKPIAYISTDFKEKFGIPRQSGRAKALTAKITFVPEFRNAEALREIEGFSHLWLLFDFSLAHKQAWSATVRPPRLGGNKRVGVFASRSPFRPNPIGLSCVQLLKVEYSETDGATLLVSGADLLDGTPILDIKPYLPFADCIPNATAGYAGEHQNDRLNVVFPPDLLQKIPIEKQAGLLDCLADDPRPSYQDDGRTYGMRFADFDVKFTVKDTVLTVTNVEKY